jgi:biopolymer transport protein ExbD
MRIKRPKRGFFAETAASSDLAFLLIIYFLVMAGFNINLGFITNLPAKDSTRLILKDDLLRFEMDGAGAIFYQNEKINFAEAETEIGRASAGHPNLAVVLSVDSEAPWQNVVLFVELAQKLKIEAFSFSLAAGKS